MKLKKIKFSVYWFIIFSVLSTVGIVFAINTITTWYRINATAQEIYRGVCKSVKTTSWNNVFAPTKTQTEWNRFISNKPGNVSIWDCVWNNSANYIYEYVIKPYYTSVHAWDPGWWTEIWSDYTTIDKYCEYAWDYLGYNYKWGTYWSQAWDITWSSCWNNTNIVWSTSQNKFIRENGCANWNRKFQTNYTNNQIACYTSTPASCWTSPHGTIANPACDPYPACNFDWRLYVNECRNGTWVANGRYKTCPAWGGCRCFISWTLVSMADGSYKNIEFIQVWEQVLGNNGTINTVLWIDESQLAGRLLYSFNGWKNFVTAEHPFRTIDGWKSIDVEALRADKASLIDTLKPTYLQVWDEILLENGESLVLETIESESAEDQIIYNLKLDGDGVYFADGFMTHHKY